MSIRQRSSHRSIYIDKDRETRYNVLSRDNYRCFMCGTGAVEVHEILPRSKFGPRMVDVLFSMRNRVSLCRECHDKAHTRLSRVQMFSMMHSRYGYDYSDEPFSNYMEK